MIGIILLLSFIIQPFTFQGLFSIYGSVRDNTGQYVSSVRVSLTDENNQPLRTVFADASGRFQFRGLRPGRYFVTVEPTGLPFEEQTQSLDLQSLSPRRSTTEELIPVDFILKRKKTRGTEGNATPGVVFVQDVPATAREEYNRGANSIKSNKLEPGIESLKKAIEIFPDYYDALELLGTEYVKREEYESAVPLLTRALTVNDKAASCMYALGVAYLKLKHFDESIEWLQKAAERDSGNPNVYMMLGLSYGNNGALEKAETALKKAYQLGGARLADAHLYLAGIYNKQERYGESWRELELYLKEAKDLKDTSQIKQMIANLKAKEKAKK